MKDRRWIFDETNAREIMRLVWAVVKTLTGRWEMSLRPAKSKRSGQQNDRYWRLMRELSAIVWLDGRQYSPETWHEYMARTFIGSEDLPGGGVKAISTTTLNVEQFGDYMTQIEAWCAEQGYQVME